MPYQPVGADPVTGQLAPKVETHITQLIDQMAASPTDLSSAVQAVQAAAADAAAARAAADALAAIPKNYPWRSVNGSYPALPLPIPPGVVGIAAYGPNFPPVPTGPWAALPLDYDYSTSGGQ